MRLPFFYADMDIIAFYHRIKINILSYLLKRCINHTVLSRKAGSGFDTYSKSFYNILYRLPSIFCSI